MKGPLRVFRKVWSMLIARVIIALGPTSVLAEFIWVREVSYRRALGIGVRHSPQSKSLHPTACSGLCYYPAVSKCGFGFTCRSDTRIVRCWSHFLSSADGGGGRAREPRHNLQPSLKKSFWCTDSMCTFSASAVSTSLGQKAHLQKQLGSSN